MGDAVNWHYSTTVAAEADVTDRASFIRKTYMHLFGAVLAFIALEAVFVNLPITAALVNVLARSKGGWLIVLVGFMAVSWLAEYMAKGEHSPAVQYLGLSLYVFAQAVIFAPLLYLLANFGGMDMIFSAGAITALLTAGLTLFVFVTGKDFSFLRSALALGGLVAIGLIVCSIIFGFSLGLFFVIGMIAFACGYILYDTSNVLHHYRIGQHVAASLALFASVTLLFWYVLRLLMALKRNN
jgi:FtsH-binding integral membrane protein